ncbi:MAG: class I SAM-dependent methyltransferase [Melioribacteraceae bacterium]|nr:class I SAM-dependent methyltransferase [Melioribacteraceae bacterium]MCF8263665.1 class I SAM-dependent methyltransferase [Melioribacteraceae bacterium]MCF8431401.1 class I SAM-dependent methyltransferase [Melioribacteraceae bacterium]
MITAFIRRRLTAEQRYYIKLQIKGLKSIFSKENIDGLFCGNNLNKLALIYGTDKFNSHYYTPHYQKHLKRFKYKKINLLEIGVGGYENPLLGGKSLRMWRRYFPFAKIFAIDIYEKSALEETRIKIFRGSQVDKTFLESVVNKIGEIDVIIDDGSHQNEHVINSFKILFPKLKDGGYYIVEDTQTSYWKKFGGDSKNLNNPNTSMGFFKSLTDSLNNKEFLIPNYEQTYFDKKIISMHFYHNLIFIRKGNNNEQSNAIVNNEPNEIIY